MKKLSKKILALLLVFAMLIPTGVLMVNTSAKEVEPCLILHVQKGGYISKLKVSTNLLGVYYDWEYENLTIPDNSVINLPIYHPTLGIPENLVNMFNELALDQPYAFTFIGAEHLSYTFEFGYAVPNYNNSTEESKNIPDDAIMFSGNYYKAYDISMSWTDAKAYCENLGGHLVTITTQAEQTFIENSFLTGSPEKWYYMIGGYRKDASLSEWYWVTGESFEYENWMHPGEATQNVKNQIYIWTISSSAPEVYVDGGIEKPLPDYKWFSHYNTATGVFDTEHTGFICEWDTNVYTIAGRKFDKNIDYFTSFTLSSEYNPELANMTAALSEAAYSEKKIKDAYTSLGFNCELFDYDGTYNPLSSGCAIGYKKSDYDESTVILVAVRGSVGSLLTGSDWHGNYLAVTNLEGKHISFSDAADRICDNINRIISDNNISGKIRYVITGHSRGAAVANLLSVRLMENGVSAPYVYNYNFACPDVACKFYFTDYINIFNLCNREDPVPFLPGVLADKAAVRGAAWGKYGQTYWFTKDAEGTIDPFADHSMKLYLEFFDQQKMPEDWGRSFWDKVDDSIDWAYGWVTKILCPVDVIVKDADGNKIASVIGGEVNYYDSSFGDVIILTDGDKKIIFVSGDNDFNVELIGTDDGTMTYSVEKCNLATEEISESKTFENVKLENGKEMYSPVSNAETTEDVELFVVENKNGEYVTTHTISTDGTETEIKINCSCDCHSNAFMQFIHKILCFFYKLFGMKQYQYCACGKAHW